MMNRTTSIGMERSARRFRSLNARFASLALLLLALVAPAWGDCPDLQVPAGNKLAFQVYAEGVQIYRWTGTSWAPVGPEAVLYANDGTNGVVGIHYGGPTWESLSGSKVIGEVRKRCTPDPNAIPWLLLEAVDSEGPGIFHRVTYIQRVNTVGGNAPTIPGGTVDQLVRVPYSTDYYFYQAHD